RLVAPEADNLLVGQPGTQVDPVHGAGLERLDPAFAVSDPEVSGITPAGAPTVPGDPAALTVVVPDQHHAVAAREVAAHVPVNSGTIAEEVLEDVEAGGDGTVGRNGLLHLRHIYGDDSERGHLGHLVGPVGIQVRAVLIAGGVRVVVLEGDALVPGRG